MSSIQVTTLKIPNPSFLGEESKAESKQPLEVTERNIAVISDPAQLLYESMLTGNPEQITRAKAYHSVGKSMTMPYPKREVF